MFKRGDVVLALFPNTDGAIAKLRPSLVVEADNLNTGLTQTVLASITTTLARAGHPSRVLVDVGTVQHRRSGLTRSSVVMTDNLATVPNVAILEIVGSLDRTDVDVALRHTLSL